MTGKEQINNELTSQDAHRAWLQSLKGILVGLKLEEVDYDFDWRDCERRFQQVQNQNSYEDLISLTCAGYAIKHTGGKEAKAEYDPLAHKAAVALGYRGNKTALIEAWHINLILYSSYFHPGYGDIHKRVKSGERIKLYDTPGGWIDFLCRASAEYCGLLESDFYEMKMKKRPQRITIEPLPQKNANQFQQIPDLKWEEVTISFISKDSIKTQARDKTKIVHWLDLGLRDGRKGDLPKKAWDTLIELAENNGAITWNLNCANPKIKIRIKELRKTLRSYFGITEDPFYSYKKCGAYKARFSIRDDTTS